MALKPGHDSQDAYRDLIQRAETYFKRLPPRDTSAGVIKWLADLEEARIWELIENYHALEFIRDDSDPMDLPEVPI